MLISSSSLAHPSLRGLILVALAVLAAGCGATCEQLKAERAAIISGPASPAPGPHMEIVVPLRELNRHLKSGARSLKTRRIVLPEFGALGAFSKGFVVQVQSLALEAGTGGSLGFRAGAVLRYKKKRIVTLDLSFDVSVTTALEEGRLVLGLGDLRASPELSRDTAAHMAKVLHPLLPGPLRNVITKGRIRSVCKASLLEIEEEVMAVLREPLLRAARATVRLPDWPVSEVAISTRKGRGGSLVIGVTTSLPGAGTVHEGARVRLGERQIGVLMSGATAAAVANHLAAAGEGGLPSRLDMEGRPDPDGELAVTYGWSPGRRPLKLHLWRLDSPCVALRLGGTPEVQVDRHAVHLRVSDGRIERVRGSLLVKVDIFLNQLWSRVFRVEVEALHSVQIKIAGERLDFSVVALTLEEDGWALVMLVREHFNAP